MIAKLKRTITDFFGLSPFKSERTDGPDRTFDGQSVWGQNARKTDRTGLPPFRGGPAVRPVRRIVWPQKSQPEGWLWLVVLYLMLQINFEPIRQPRFVDPTIGERLQQKLSGSRQGAAALDPIIDRAGRAPRDEGEVFVADVVVVKEGLKVFHDSHSMNALITSAASGGTMALP